MSICIDTVMDRELEAFEDQRLADQARELAIEKRTEELLAGVLYPIDAKGICEGVGLAHPDQLEDIAAALKANNTAQAGEALLKHLLAYWRTEASKQAEKEMA